MEITQQRIQEWVDNGNVTAKLDLDEFGTIRIT